MGWRNVPVLDNRNLRALGIDMVTNHLDGTGDHNQVVVLAFY
ncbi:conserved hypothetical protein [Vibrio chagasii]|nr:conserved hypothetical protein [Vibrio chagasii]CAH6892724.1 conserved hypothetical protein [Vibrio chagasii]CAH7139870.1 conserved hypothetical protein [Vibrio chagasii]CAH7143261.1 conserved hypothetical protein [Vibrio chagasii]CAH7165490.1 conserved hypothetical protein [Vibrio chagasii]